MTKFLLLKIIKFINFYFLKPYIAKKMRDQKSGTVAKIRRKKYEKILRKVEKGADLKENIKELWRVPK